jgi:aminopeptidase N
MRDANPKTIYLKDYKAPDYLIDKVNLNFSLDEDHTKIVSHLSIARNPASQIADVPLILAGENLTLIRLVLNDEHELSKDDYLLTDESLTIYNVPQHRAFTLTIENEINPKLNTALEGLYLSNGMLCTQCEAEGFRKITFFLDRPDVMAQFTTTLTADKNRFPTLLSNGNKIAFGESQDNQHWVTWEDPFKKPCYLFALVAGQLDCIEDSFVTASGKEVGLQIFVEQHDIDKCDHAMASLKNAMRWDERAYGREYDLDLYMIVAVSHFNMGAMENKGLNIFNTKFVLARPETATDSDYEHIEGVIGHEYFHNWTGNRITCRDWFQLSLKEGFTVFRDQEFSCDRSSRAVKRIEDVNMLRTRQFAEDAGPMAHPIRPDSYIEINNFYTLTVYEKGAEVVRMLHTLLGPDGFRKGSDCYFDRHDGQAVTCDDFVKCMEDANAIDLSQFRRWYSQAGTPVIQVKEEYDSANQSLTLTFHQHSPPTPGQSDKLPLHIPIKIGLIGSDGKPLECRLENEAQGSEELILQLKQSEQQFRLTKLAKKPVVSVLRNFSAPVKLDMDRNLDELAFLLSFDTDSFNRWEAGQQLASILIKALIADIQKGHALSLNPILVDALKKVINQSWSDLSYFSLLLSLPSETFLAEQMQVIDVEAIHQAREFVVKSLAVALKEDLETLYLTHHRDESGQFSADAIGRRRIKNICLSYLSRHENERYQDWSEQQFYSTRNMTDQIAALASIVNFKHPAKDHCLADFYHQWQDEALVIDKWFTIQAASPMPDTFNRVNTLMKHDAFDLANPNRVRALIGSFSQGNPIHFHAANGQGYEFLADQVLALNILNPQVASRMLGPLTSWRRFDDGRQRLMKAQLEKIMGNPSISRDVYEVASKSLQ